MATEKWDARLDHPIPHDLDYYLKCVQGGIMSCGLTHTFVVPLDNVKCNMQVDPIKYPNLSTGFRVVRAERGFGPGGLCKGWLPTLMGYSAQGAFKFGFYEFFKDYYMNLVGQEFSKNWKGPIWLAASASAEIIADVFLCPFEMLKVRMQTDSKASLRMLEVAGDMRQRAHVTGFPFKSLVPLWSRQVPYTMAKFYIFEKVVNAFYANVFTKPKDSYSKAQQLSITFASGYIAGVACAIVSHPADTLVSLNSKPANAGKGYGQVVSEFGMANLFTKGLPVRILMIGTLTGLQWWIYDTYKTAMGLGTAGGSAQPAAAKK